MDKINWEELHKLVGDVRLAVRKVILAEGVLEGGDACLDALVHNLADSAFELERYAAEALDASELMRS